MPSYRAIFTQEIWKGQKGCSETTGKHEEFFELQTLGEARQAARDFYDSHLRGGRENFKGEAWVILTVEESSSQSGLENANPPPVSNIVRLRPR